MDVGTLAQKLEEAYQRDLEEGRWEEGATLSDPMRYALFHALPKAKDIDKVEQWKPEYIAVLVYNTFHEHIMEVATIIDYAAFPIWSMTIFEVLCNEDEGRAATAFVQFCQLYAYSGSHS